MAKKKSLNQAEEASKECLDKVYKALDSKQNFLVEAGAGAGKTYTLIKALHYQIEKYGDILPLQNKRIACITYTNVAKDEIRSRTDNHPVIFADTIHAFAWSIIKDFQAVIRQYVPGLSERWKERIDATSGLALQKVIYDFGYPKADDSEIHLHHDDVLKLFTLLLHDGKFQQILTNKFPVIFIDEYQDTNKELAQAIVSNFIETSSGPLFGFFGDHWQKIYGSNSCGLITASAGKLVSIGKQANFRSAKNNVDALNKMRPELTQFESDPLSKGEIAIYHSNNWVGVRRTGQHWKDDLPEKEAHEYLEKTIALLNKSGWDTKNNPTKILMLTNNVLAAEQGYSNVAIAFNDTDDFLKKNDDYIAFLSDVVEPGVEAFSEKKYGQMLRAFETSAPRISKHSEKSSWHKDLTELTNIRTSGVVGDVIDLLKKTGKPRLSRRVGEKEEKYSVIAGIDAALRSPEDISFFDKINSIRNIPYAEFINALKYINEKTLFSTQHGVKGAQFENVIVLGRGWNNYDWNKMLEWFHTGVPADKEASFERNRNLFYVACSRPKKRLALLFTQKLTTDAMTTLTRFFGVNLQPL